MKINVLFWGIIFIILLISSGLLIAEYRYFREQVRIVLALQGDYREHINSLKERLGRSREHESGDDQKVKNSENTDQELIPVNRESLYLRNSAALFGKKHNVAGSVDPCYEETTQNLSSNNPLPGKQQIRRGATQQQKTRTFIPVDFSLAWPIERSKFWLSSTFGPRGNSFHYGIDMAAMKGTPVYASMAGTVIEASYTPRGYGKCIVIDHKQCRTRYAHLKDMYVKVGQQVKKLETIGCVGDTGLVRGKNDASHLHFEVFDLFGKRMNPLYILR